MKLPIPLSVLDLAPITLGSSPAEAFRNTLSLARLAENLGYHRFWMAEHHGMPGVASAATSVLLGYVAGGTSTIRVGAGGIMLPNHSPLVIAEQFGTLESIYPGRIDLGLGRAPGSDWLTMRALRRDPRASDRFPQDVLELQAFLGDGDGSAGVSANREAGVDATLTTSTTGTVIGTGSHRVIAVPGRGLKVPLWILGSSLFGAQLAAEFGLPYAFASHFAPTQMMEAIRIYRQNFKPSAQLNRPYVMLGVNIIAAESDEEGQMLFSSLQQMFLSLRHGNPGPLPPPIPGFSERMGPMDKMMLDQALSCSVVGSERTVKEGVERFVEQTGADELMITTQIFDHQLRLRSFEMIARQLLSSANP